MKGITFNDKNRTNGVAARVRISSLLKPKLMATKSQSHFSNKMLTNKNQNITVPMSLKNKNNKKIDRIGAGFSSFGLYFYELRTEP